MKGWIFAKKVARRLPSSMGRPLRRAREFAREFSRARQIRRLFPPQELETPPCAICDSCSLSRHHTFNGFHIVRCQICGLIFASPRPKDLKRFYDNRYYTGGLPGVYADYQAHAHQYLPEWRSRMDTIERVLGSTGILLDVGAATGEFLHEARDRGWVIAGLEVSEWAVGRAQERYGIELICGSLPKTDLDTGTFDAVTLWDCIEHVPNPRAVLLDAHRILKPSGLLMLTTGALPHNDRDLESRWYYPPWHLYYFSKQTITALLMKCKFEVIEYSQNEQSGIEYALMTVVARVKATSGIGASERSNSASC